MSTIFQLIVAGHDTTSSLIGNGVVALLTHPDQLDGAAAPTGADRRRRRGVDPLRRPGAALDVPLLDRDRSTIGGVTIPAGAR